MKRRSLLTEVEPVDNAVMGFFEDGEQSPHHTITDAYEENDVPRLLLDDDDAWAI